MLRHDIQPPGDRDGFRFRGGSPAIDLTATLQGRLKGSPRELLATPADLDRWLVSAGLSSAAPNAGEEDLRVARELREAIFVLAGNAGTTPFDADALQVLNRVAAALPAATPALRADGTIELRGSASNLLSRLAWEAVYILGGEEVTRLRQCQASNCTIFFVDTSRSGDRRWCSMSACGNRAKVAEFRRRRRAGAGDQ